MLSVKKKKEEKLINTNTIIKHNGIAISHVQQWWNLVSASFKYAYNFF